MLRYIDSTPIFTREAPSLTYSEHLTSQTLQATFFLSRPMSPLRYIVALEIFSKSCHGNPMGTGRVCSRVRVRPRCLRPPPPADRRSGQIFSSRPMSSHQRGVSVPATEIPWENFFIGKSSAPLSSAAAPRRSPIRPNFFEPSHVVPLARRLCSCDGNPMG